MSEFEKILKEAFKKFIEKELIKMEIQENFVLKDRIRKIVFKKEFLDDLKEIINES